MTLTSILKNTFALCWTGSGGKQMEKSRRSFRAVLWIIGILGILAFGCSNEKPDSRAKADSPRGFTFFDLGANSKYSRSVRARLGKKLGSDSISQKNTIDLSIHDNGFLKKWFPGLADLNRQLNWPAGQRVEHNTTKLMYRYARIKNTPFIYVELFFSDDTLKPLLFRIVAGPDGNAILKTIRKKIRPSKGISVGAERRQDTILERWRQCFHRFFLQKQTGYPGISLLHLLCGQS